MKCQEVDELAGAYALQALSPDEMSAVERHLETCDKHASLADLLAVAAALPAAVPEMEPPARLKARLMEAIRAESASPASAPAPRQPGWLDRLFSSFRPARALTVALMLVVVGLLSWNIYLQSTDGGGSAAVVRDLTAGGQVQGKLTYLQDQGVTVIKAQGLEPLPADKTYQAWAIKGGTPTSIGIFRSSPSGEALATVTADLSDADKVAVTVETAGGSQQPTTASVLEADL